MVIGLGGGKALDAGKAVSLRLGVPVVTVPTVASNDSPTSKAVAMYDDGTGWSPSTSSPPTRTPWSSTPR